MIANKIIQINRNNNTANITLQTSQNLYNNLNAFYFH